MVKAGQFTTKSRVDTVIAVKQQRSLWYRTPRRTLRLPLPICIIRQSTRCTMGIRMGGNEIVKSHIPEHLYIE